MMAYPLITLTCLVFLTPMFGTAEIVWAEEQNHAPNFRLPSIQGQVVSLNEYKGKVVLLNFWATWCRDCVLEMPELEKLYQKFRSKGLTILAIALDKEGQPAVRTFLKKENLDLTYPILLDPGETVARAYRLSWVPVTIMVGQEGEIIETVLGARPWGSEEVMHSFEQLLHARGND
ncbi:MAG TPA: TlpA disulfide reductase family protein [Nitrospirales bacterium]|nr:thiol-disulfide oxidoreductase [Nitrospiraceae bacterium]HNP30272.1 TlpA disulfide reductase family protein [Nitrospirales bacterium]